MSKTLVSRVVVIFLGIYPFCHVEMREEGVAVAAWV